MGQDELDRPKAECSPAVPHKQIVLRLLSLSPSSLHNQLITTDNMTKVDTPVYATWKNNTHKDWWKDPGELNRPLRRLSRALAGSPSQGSHAVCCR